MSLRYRDKYEIVSYIVEVVGNILFIFIFISMLSHDLGIDLFALFRELVTKPWVMPAEIKYKYMWLWLSMRFILYVVMFFDYAYFQARRMKKLPPPSQRYTLAVAMIYFMLAGWLFLIFGEYIMLFLFFLSTIVLGYQLFLKPPAEKESMVEIQG